MKNMTPKHKKAFILSVVVFATGLAVMAVYMFGLVSQRDAAVAMAQNIMSFSSAICFVLSAVALYYIARVMDGEVVVAQLVLPLASLVIAVLISVHWVFMFMGDPYAVIGQSLNIESYDILDQILLTHPSFAAMINFLLVSVAGVLATMCVPCRSGMPCSEKNYDSIGKIILVVSVVAFVDRFLHLSHLVGLPDKSIGIGAFFMFILLGAGLMTVCRSR